MLFKILAVATIAALSLTATMTGAIAQSCPQSSSAGRPVLSVRFDNDVLGGRGQDQNYTGGTIITLMTPDLVDYLDDPCLPDSIRWINRKLSWLHPRDVTQQNMVLGLAHLAFTPGDKKRSDLITDDRPYAAALLLSIGFNGRNSADLRTTHLRLGMIGPAAQGERVQNQYHDTLGLDRFKGWNNQLRNEVVVQLLHERLHRWATDSAQTGWGSDLISHWGGSLGNFATYANAGAELRFGWRVPDDFGSTSLRPAGENTAPNSTYSSNNGWSGHLFVTIDGRVVARDITLDGNTFQSSHHVHKRTWVADLGFGLVVLRGNWKVALARYYRTREFDGQQDLPAFGSITVSRRF